VGFRRVNEPTAEETGPSWKQGLLLFFGGIVLTISFCAGALTARDPWQTILGFGFIGSFFMICFGVVALIIRMSRGS